MPFDQADRSAEGPVDRYRLLLRLQILAAIGCLLIFTYSLRFWATGDLLRILGTGVLVAGAALLSGFLFGFIFGIPRVGGEKATTRTANGPNGTNAGTSEANLNHITTNSNLVEISDWLTKILVGVGLVELSSFPRRLGELSHYLGIGLRPAFCGGGACADFATGGEAVGLAIVVFYFTLGFLWGYVWTLLYFQRDLGGLVEKLERNKRVTDLIMLAEASINEGRLDEAMESIDQALENDPKDGRAVLTKGRILKRQAMNVENPQRKTLLSRALDCANQAIALLPGAGEPIYNKACYQALLNFDKDETLNTLKTAFRLNPGLRTIAGGDDDLTSLRDVPEFARLITTNQNPGT